MREFDTEDILVARKHVKSSKKIEIAQKLVFLKRTIYSPREGYTELILAPAFAVLLGSREVLNKSEGISSQDGKYTIHHGDSQACTSGGHQIFHHDRTIGK